MSFNIEQIKIELSLNTGQQPVTLKSSMLELSDLKKKPVGLNEYPYFTIDVEYPKNKLYSLQSEDLLLFFFNKDKFTEYLSAYIDEDELKKSLEESYENKKYRIEYNIMTMLELLLPTRFPVYNDIHKSHDHIFNPAKSGKLWIDPPVLFWNRFSYLSVNGKKYTCKKIIWLNDIFNHPRYRELLNYYRKFIIWYKEQLDGLKKKIEVEDKEQKIRLTDAVQDIANYIHALMQDYVDRIEDAPDTKKKDRNGKPIKDKVTKKPIIIRGKKAAERKSAELTSDVKDFFVNIFTEIIRLENKAVISEIDFSKYDSIPQLSALLAEVKEKESKNPKESDEANAKPTVGDLFVERVTRFVNYLNETRKRPIFNLVDFQFDDKNPTLRQTVFNSTMKKHLSDVTKLTTTESALKKRYEFFSTYVTDSYEDIQKKTGFAGVTISSEYINFNMNELKRYRRPFCISTNNKLQGLVNGKTSEAITQFYNVMDPIYEFMRVGSFEKSKNVEELTELCNVGLCEINTNDLRGVRREIHVYLDLIDGEINNTNVNSIFCPFVGDHLGNEVEYLIRLSNVGKTPRDRWNVFRNRMLFSLKQMSSNRANAEQKMEVIGKPMAGSNQEPYAQTGNVRDANFIENMFMKEIVYKNTQELNKLLNTIVETCSTAGESTNVGTSDIFPYIVKQNDDLYRILKKWSQHESIKNRDVIEQMNIFKALVTARKATIKDKIDSRNMPQEYKFKLNCDLAKAELFIFLIDKLIEHEKSKQRETGSVYVYQGGSKRKTNRKMNRRSMTKKSRK